MQDGTNKPVNRFLTIDGKKYYVDADDTRVEKRWFFQTSVPNNPQQKPSASWFYAGSNGAEWANWYSTQPNGALMRSSFIVLDGKTYFFDANEETAKNPM